MEVRSEKNYGVNGLIDFYLEEANQSLWITFGGNGDLYWALNVDSEEYIPLKKREKSQFKITKENYFIYSLFEQIYDDISNCKVFEPAPIEINLCATQDDFEQLETDHEALNQSLKKGERYQNLYHDGIIEWRSDESYYEDANSVEIRKNGEEILLDFIHREEEISFCDYSIRFRNSGSSYSPFNAVFMKMFNKLQEYDPNNHQIHIEEYLYKQKIKKR